MAVTGFGDVSRIPQKLSKAELQQLRVKYALTAVKETLCDLDVSDKDALEALDDLRDAVTG